MLKTPRPGRVKTRLGRDIGMVPAAWWFRHQTAQLLRRLDDPRWQLVLAVAPDRDGLSFRGGWPHHLPRVPQGHGTLGDRMRRVFRSMPPGPVCIVGGDIPGINRPHVARAFDALGQNDAVFGPAHDGGYWLVGMKRTRSAPRAMFHGVRWSTEHALADSITTLSGRRIALVDTLQDIDTALDLRAVQRPRLRRDR
jgi:rSAM/selenodomain-associated transferase 1